MQFLDRLIRMVSKPPVLSRRTKIALSIATLLAVLGAIVAAVLYLNGKSFPILSPKGTIAADERNLIIFGSLLSLLVVVPVFIMLFYFLWKYRASNTKAKYSPDWDNSKAAEAVWWLVPLALIVVLSVVTWTSSHRLDPFRPIASDKKTLTIQVVAMQWKWLFIYPEQNIATVNYVQFPEDTPVNFRITSDAPMNSFWIPALGGQMYAMSGMTTQLHLMADAPGTFQGASANISGAGFSDMRFTAKASTSKDFDAWVQAVKQARQPLTSDSYAELARPNVGKMTPRTYYSSVEPGLYDTILMKYMLPGHYVAPTPTGHTHGDY